MYKCNTCGQSFTRKYTLKQHKLKIHERKRKYLDENNSDDDESYPPLERSDNDAWKFNQTPGFAGYESLIRSDAVPENDIVRGPNSFAHQGLTPRSEPFKFKHPFCMMVAGPSRSGKTQWVVKLLKERRERIDPPVHGE